MTEPHTSRAHGSGGGALGAVTERQVHAVRRNAADHRFHALAAMEARDQMALAVRGLLATGMSTDAVARLCELSLAGVLSLEHLAHQVLKDS